MQKKTGQGARLLGINRHDVKKSRCPVPQIPETEITAAVQRMCSKLKLNAESILVPLLAQLKELRERELRSNQKISDIDKELARMAEQNLVLTRLKSKGYIDSTLYFAQQDEINQKLLELKKLRRYIMALANEEGQIQATESMIEYLADAPEWMERIEPELLDSLVKEIRLVSADEIRIKLHNGLEKSAKRYSVSGAGKPTLTIRRSNQVKSLKNRGNPLILDANTPFTQDGFQLCPHLLNGVQIRAIWRQI